MSAGGGGCKGGTCPFKPPSHQSPTRTTTPSCRDGKGLPPSRHNPANAHVANLPISRDQCVCTLSLRKACQFCETVLLQTMHRVQPARILLSCVSMWQLTFPKNSPSDLYLLEHTFNIARKNKTYKGPQPECNVEPVRKFHRCHSTSVLCQWLHSLCGHWRCACCYCFEEHCRGEHAAHVLMSRSPHQGCQNWPLWWIYLS